MGMDIGELESRECRCGCGKQWKCLKTSTQFYWATWHNKVFMSKFYSWGDQRLVSGKKQASNLHRS